MKAMQKEIIRTIVMLTLCTLCVGRMLDQTVHKPLLTSKVTRGLLANLFSDGAKRMKYQSLLIGDPRCIARKKIKMCVSTYSSQKLNAANQKDRYMCRESCNMGVDNKKKLIQSSCWKALM